MNHTVEQRLASLERSRRAGWVAAGLFATVALALGADNAKELRTTRLVIENDDGGSAIVFETFDNQPKIHLHDPDGNARASLSLLKDGSPNLYLRGARTKAAVSLGVTTKTEFPILNVTESDGERRRLRTDPAAGARVSGQSGGVVVP